jgi:cytochrome o ubiquinol oxidase operon protein cyoD
MEVPQMSDSPIEKTEKNKINARVYMTGFILAVVLTIISFALVMSKISTRHIVIEGLIVAAISQMLVHLHYFLHLDRSSSARWNVLALVFTGLLLFIFVGGTIWVMYTLNSRMMQ